MAEERERQPDTLARLAWRRFKKNRTAIFGAMVVILLFVLAAGAPVLAPQDPNKVDMDTKYTAPSAKNLLGTDELGRDVLSRLIYGAQIVVMVAVGATIVATVLGVGVGLVAGYAGGWADAWIMRALDVVLAFPAFLLAIALVAFMGPSVTNIIIVIAITRLPRYARIIRSSVLSLKELDYVEAARATGATPVRILLLHVLPGCLGPMAVYSSLTLGDSILTVSGLSFLGIGIQPPTSDWGMMLTRGREYMLVAPWMPIIPGAAIFLTVMGFNLLGDGLRDALDPRG